MREYVREVTGKRISLKGARKLIRKKGLKAVYPDPKTTESTNIHYVNFLEEKKITKPNQVWFAGITYVRVAAEKYRTSEVIHNNRKNSLLEVSL